jgi:hypothetical protein
MFPKPTALPAAAKTNPTDPLNELLSAINVNFLGAKLTKTISYSKKFNYFYGIKKSDYETYTFNFYSDFAGDDIRAKR